MTCSIGQTHRLPLDGKRILIADDDAVTTEALTSELVALWATVLKASTAEDALKQAHSAIAVCVIDPQIPGRNVAPIEQALLEERIPFVVHTHQAGEASRWSSMPLILKPDRCGEVARTVLRLASMSPP
jgi:DNA-binding NtrC family response regulator